MYKRLRCYICCILTSSLLYLLNLLNIFTDIFLLVWTLTNIRLTLFYFLSFMTMSTLLAWHELSEKFRRILTYYLRQLIQDDVHTSMQVYWFCSVYIFSIVKIALLYRETFQNKIRHCFMKFIAESAYIFGKLASISCQYYENFNDFFQTWYFVAWFASAFRFSTEYCQPGRFWLHHSLIYFCLFFFVLCSIYLLFSWQWIPVLHLNQS